jgi:hypothetical protein
VSRHALAKTVESSRHPRELRRGVQRPVRIDADAGARPPHPRGAPGLKLGAKRLVGAVQDALRCEGKPAEAATLRIVVGVGQHDLVHVDVAVIGRQLLGLEIGGRKLKTTKPGASNVTQEDGASWMRSDMTG